MGIGQRKQIKLIQLTPSKGAEGNWNTTVETSFNTWAEISNVSSFRGFEIGQNNLGETKRFRVRFRFDVYPGADWKVRYDGKDWTISSIQRENEKSFYWNIQAQAK